MAETKARFLANLIGADNTANDFTLPNTAVSGTDKKVLTSGGDGTVSWQTTLTAPEFASMSGTVNEDDQTTLTINGGQFVAGMTVDVYNNSDAKLNTTSLSTNLISGSQITVDIPNNTSTNGFPIASGTVIYLKIIKSGLSVSTSNITVNADPVWGSVSSPYVNVINGATGNVGSALTEPTISSGSGTITYAITTQPSDGVNKYSINSSRQISVDSTSNSSAGNLLSSAMPKTDAIAVRATGPAGATQASDLAVNIAVYQYAGNGGTGSNYSDNSYRSHKFDYTGSNQTFTLYQATTVDILVVAGGGGGGGGNNGNDGGGGGGAGGMMTFASQSLSAGDYTIVVGGGGAGSTGQGYLTGAGATGGNSRFGTLTEVYGGGGGGTPGNNAPSGTFGSGGGAAGSGGGPRSGGSGTSGQGNNGASNTDLRAGYSLSGSGGGGKGSAGEAQTTGGTGRGSNGGSGANNNYLTGANITYAGGGGGGGGTGGNPGQVPGGSGGSGGGGNGGALGSSSAEDATDGLGGGGGGGANNDTGGGDGGNGVVIVRYAL